MISKSPLKQKQKITKVHQGTHIPGKPESSSSEPAHFMHHVSNNATHTSRTLDGCTTFYGMGIICSVTPAVSLSFTITDLEDVSTEELIRLIEIE